MQSSIKFSCYGNNRLKGFNTMNLNTTSIKLSTHDIGTEVHVYIYQRRFDIKMTLKIFQGHPLNFQGH